MMNLRSARWIFLAFAFTVLLMSWEMQMVNPALATSDIPQEAIRMRILANSDSPADQWVKQRVRDRVVASLNEWVADPTSVEGVRAEIAAHLSELERIVGDELRRLGRADSYTVSYGKTDFPPKVHGHRVYPAGDYEALLITIGNGKGLNWWCVMFPPLCFVDLVAGEAKAASDSADEPAAETAAAEEEPEVKFMLAELVQRLVSMVKGWF